MVTLEDSKLVEEVDYAVLNEVKQSQSLEKECTYDIFLEELKLQDRKSKSKAKAPKGRPVGQLRTMSDCEVAHY